MTSRERMRRFYAGEPIDRIPNALGACETAGMHLLAYDNLKRILGVDDPTNRMYTFMTNAVFEPSVLEAMGGDCIVLNSRMCPSPLWGPAAEGMWKDQALWGKMFQVPVDWEFRTDPDGTIWWGERNKCPPGCIYFDHAADAAPPPSTPAAPPSPDDLEINHERPEEWLRALEDAARCLYETTDYSIVVGESIHDLQPKPGGMQSWYIRMLTEPQACHDFLGKFTDAALAHLRQVHQAVGKYCGAMIMADDLGDCRGVTMGPDLWREIYKPHYKRLWSEWKSITPLKIMLHSCGSVVDILGDLVECGLDIFNPIQRSARGMDPENLVEKFGDDLIFYGGALDAVITPPGTPDELVYEEAKKVITAFAANGRYMFAGTHNIPGDTPPGHLDAIMRA
ncbi:hypothetical protein HQ560_03520, partial [bacterium]|nr:hypothetical protein [bacterium]